MHNNWSLLPFVTPALLFFIIFKLTALSMGFYYSFTDWNGLRLSYNFVGFGNFIEALTDDMHFKKSMGFTLKFVIVNVALSNIVAIALAVLIESRLRSKAWFRTFFFMPNLISYIIGAFIWSYIFVEVFRRLAEVSALRFLDQEWLGNPSVSFWSIIIVSVWNLAGYLMLVYLAALQGISKDLKDSAKVDGAGAWQMFKSITFPLIMHGVTICMFLSLSISFKTFELIYGLTEGGPGRATEVMAYNIYKEAFSYNFRYGYANAKAIILFVFVVCITLLQVWITKKREVES